MAGMTVLAETVLVAQQKGGNGKSSVVAALGVSIARTGRKVLVVDADQQGNLTVDDLGVPEDRWDKGKNLAIALQYGLGGGVALEPYRNIRPNLDILMGGPAIGQVSTAVAAAGETVDLAENFEVALSELCEREQYDIILVDSGHGDKVLLIALMQVCRYLVVPTNAKVKMEGEIARVLAKDTADMKKKFVFQDWKKINENRSAWIDRFNKEIKV